MNKNYVKTGIRNLMKNKSYSLINITSLALGMVACIYIGLWIQDELNFDGFHQNYKQLYRLTTKMSQRWNTSTPWALLPGLKSNYPEIKQGARFSRRKYNLRVNDKNSNENGALIDREFLQMFSFPLIKGKIMEDFDTGQSVLISEQLARKFFQTKDPLGQAILINNDKQCVISGILKDVPDNSHLEFDFLVPCRQFRRNVNRDWSYDCSTYLLLDGKINDKEFGSKIASFIEKNDTGDLEVDLRIQPFKKIHLYALNGTDPIVYIYIFLGLALLIIFIASVNFINLSISRSVFRAKEIGLRKVIGADKGDIFRQFMGESVGLSLIALLLAVPVSLLLIPLFNQLSGKNLLMAQFFTPLNLTVVLMMGILTGVLSSLYPSLLLASMAPIKTVRGKVQYSMGNRTFKRVIVTAQFVVTVVMIIVSFSMMSQMNFIQNMDLGLNKDQVLAVPINEQLSRNYEVFKNNLLRHSGILKVTSAYNNPTDIRHSNMIMWDKSPSDRGVSISDQSVDYGYFDLFDMKIVRGRSFRREIQTDAGGYVINEAAQRLLGYKDPIGKEIIMWRTPGPIIGVVKDFHSVSVHEEIKPIVFMVAERHGRRSRMFVKVKSRDITKTLDFIKNKAFQFAPGNEFEYVFLDGVFAGQYADDQRSMNLYSFFTLLAIFISCLGLYGLVSSALGSKIREIGVRKVMGASVFQIAVLIFKEFFIIISISALIGSPLALLIGNRMLNNYVHRITLNPWFFIGAWLLILFIAVMTVLGRVMKAALANPIQSLRAE